MSYDIEKLGAERNVSTEAVEARIAAIWDALGEDPKAAELVAGRDNPFRAERREGQFGFAETIAIAVIGGVGKDIASTLWKEYVWPQLKAHFGADLKKAETTKPEE